MSQTLHSITSLLKIKEKKRYLDNTDTHINNKKYKSKFNVCVHMTHQSFLCGEQPFLEENTEIIKIIRLGSGFVLG